MSEFKNYGCVRCGRVMASRSAKPRCKCGSTRLNVTEKKLLEAKAEPESRPAPKAAPAPTEAPQEAEGGSSWLDDLWD